MKKKVISLLLCAAMLSVSVLSTCGPVFAAQSAQESVQEEKSDELRLWYSSEAPDSYSGWENWSLPIGNGYMGGSVFGGVGSERVQFNEKTLWTGGPDAEKRPDYNYGILEGKEDILPRIRQLFVEGKDQEAKALTGQLTGANAAVASYGFGAYQNFGDMYFDFGFDPEQATNYVRDLDLHTATASVKFDYEGVRYEREYFANYPDNVMVMRFSADQAAKMTFDARMVSAQGGQPVAEGNKITLRGRISDNNMIYESQMQLIPTGGSIVSDGSKLTVLGADSVVVIMTAGTDYANDFPVYRGEDPHDAVTARMASAADKTYEELKQRHLEDYEEIFSRVELDLDHTVPNIPTNELLSQYKQGNQSKYLEVLLYQYGRYLTIASSREGSLPSNLQGVWNASNSPAWNSDYHFDVNIQMNYWPTYSTNMAECALPLVEYIDSLREPGRLSAQAYNSIVSDEQNPENGFVIQPINNPFGWTAPGHETYWGWAPGCGAWVLQNVWDYYDYTRDVDFLREKIYPMMKEQAKFWQQSLIYDEESDRMVDIPSISPEQGIVAKGTTYSQELAWQLFSDTIEASEILGVDEDLRAEWQYLKDMVKPLHIGEDGQLKEWYEETTFGSMGNDRKHRHMSHLLGLFPGDHISKEDPVLLEAARVSLDDHGDKSTGWAMGQRINAWARVGDGNRSHKLIQSLMNNGILNNLWDTHAPFQIDGNFGYTSGVTEMLMQSHLGYIELLPALPDVWQNGHVNGLVARGNFVMDLEWENGSAKQVKLTSRDGGFCKVRYDDISLATVTDADGTPVAFESLDGDTISFETTAGQSYVISQIPAGLAVKAAPGNGLATSKGDGNVNLSWSTVDNAESYQVYRSVNFGQFYALAETTETNYTDLTADPALGKIYYKVSAIVDGHETDQSDRIGITAPAGADGFINDDSPMIRYSPNWNYWAESGYKGGSCHYIDNATSEDHLSMEFQGTGIEVYATKYSNGGSLDIFIDGVKYGDNISMRAGGTQKAQKIFEKTDLSAGTHTLQIVVNQPGKIAVDGFVLIDKSNEHPAESITVTSTTGSKVIGAPNGTLQMQAEILPVEADQGIAWSVETVDGKETSIASIDQNGLLTAGTENGIVVVKAVSTDGSGVSGSAEVVVSVATQDQTKINDNDPSIQYSAGHWTYYKESPYYMGDCHYASNYGDASPTITYVFEGTGIEVYMAINTASSIHGLLDISIDGKPQETYNLGGAPADLKQQKVFGIHGLPNPEHTIVLAPKAREAGKDQAIFDFFTVYSPAEGAKDRSALHNQIDAAAKLNPKEYTQDSWNQMTEVLQQAVAAMNDFASSQDQLDEKTLALKQAVADLQAAPPDTNPPTTPGAFGAIGVEEDTLLLTWDASEDDIVVQGYRIYQNGEKIAETAATNYRVSGLEAGTTYEFAVSAIDKSGNESQPAVATVTTLNLDGGLIAAPVNAAVGNVSFDSAVVSWEAGSEQSEQYEVYLDGVRVGRTDQTSFELTGLTEKTEYLVKIRALGANAEKSLPTAVSFTTPLEIQPNKTILDQVIIYASEAVKTEEYLNVIPSVKQSFDAALADALSVQQSLTATQDQVDAAWMTLMTEIHKLGFQAGDKEILSALVSQAEEINGKLDRYLDGAAKDSFVTALSGAKDVLADADALVADVEHAVQELLDTMLELRYQPNKEYLKEALNRASRIDLNSYTEQSVLVFQSAVTYGETVFADEKARDADVEKAVTDITNAMKALKKRDTNSITPVVAGEKDRRTESSSPKTGETLPIAALAVSMLASAVLLYRRKNIKN